MPIQHVALHSNYLRRTLAMDPDSTTLDLDSGDNTTGAQETLQVPLHQDIENCSLQDAFKAFREKRRDKLREQSRVQPAPRERQRDKTAMDSLREKFLQTALSYCGVPYAQRYHQPDSPTHHSPLFLDCCGLVRRVLRDLKDDFGFTVGPWNQAYQFDTLPVGLSGPADMKPGDLVFISATYYNQQRKRQRHDMVHVEIWLGQGEKTVGARWQRGSVEVHESYQFVSKSYHSMHYHFRSIDTWLKGVCQSFCPEHEWRIRDFTPGKYSVFSLQQDQSCGQAEEVKEGEGEEREGEEKGRERVEEEEEREQEEKGRREDEGGGGKGEGEMVVERVLSSQGAPPDMKCVSHTDPPTVKSPVRQRQRSPSKPVAHPPRPRASRGQSRTFIVCGGNGAHLVHSVLTSRGWLPLEDKTSSAFTLKWTETSKHINYKEFREGEQIVNHFPNISLLTTKIGLLESLRALQRLQQSTGTRGTRVSTFLPETYRLDKDNERTEFNKVYSSSDLWICKPTGANQGKGIFLVRDLQQVVDRLESDRRSCKIASRPTPRIVQRYITPPLLLGGRKFDIRVYLLVVAARPYVVLYADGYVRLSCASYNAASGDVTVHLTNQFQQKKHPDYMDMREDTVWNFSKLQDQLSHDHRLPPDWVHSTLTHRMKAIMWTCFHSVRHKLSHKTGYFDLLGFDFMLDAQLNIWLIEVNVNPALHTNCATLQALVPPLVCETLDIVIEIFDKCRRNRSILPLSSLSLFSVLIS